MKRNLFIISNESIFENRGNFYCDNIDLKSTPEGLNDSFNVNLIARKTKKKRSHKINLNKIFIYNNIFSYLRKIYSSLKFKNSNYLLISISPYTFLGSLFLLLFKKKLIVYLRSDGYEEYKKILGWYGPFIYHFMFFIVSKNSTLISCRKHILKKKPGKLIIPSQINYKWMVKPKKVNTNRAKFLYVGRLKKEKGIFSLIKLMNKSSFDFELTIVGKEKNIKFINLNKKIIIKNIETNEKKLIKIYDDHNIFILPSFTEGNPMVIVEALSRLRPIIIFREISHVVQNRKGIFLTDRSLQGIENTSKLILSNYNKIQGEMKKNQLPTKEKFLKKLTNYIINEN